MLHLTVIPWFTGHSGNMLYSFNINIIYTCGFLIYTATIPDLKEQFVIQSSLSNIIHKSWCHPSKRKLFLWVSCPKPCLVLSFKILYTVSQQKKKKHPLVRGWNEVKCKGNLRKTFNSNASSSQILECLNYLILTFGISSSSIFSTIKRVNHKVT